jgi:hypothetical protein
MWFRLVPVLLVCLLAWSPGRGETVRDYGFPFTDPLQATVIGTPPEFQADLPERIPFRMREIRVLPGREVPEIFWYAANLQYSLSAQPGPAPLAFIIPGTGANFDASKSVILQRALYQAGLHVVSLPSPLHPNFIVSASTSLRPGLLTRDAQDLYRAMELIRGQIEDEIAITGYGLVGYSLGGSHAAFVAQVDEARQSFAFDRVLLINPPVSLDESARVLDRMFEENIPSVAAFNALFNQLMAVLSEVYTPTEPLLLSEDLLYNLYRHRAPRDSTLEALIGAVPADLDEPDLHLGRHGRRRGAGRARPSDAAHGLVHPLLQGGHGAELRELRAARDLPLFRRAGARDHVRGAGGARELARDRRFPPRQPADQPDAQRRRLHGERGRPRVPENGVRHAGPDLPARRP